MPETLSENSFPLTTSLSAFYYNVHGEIVEANGLKGKLGQSIENYNYEQEIFSLE